MSYWTHILGVIEVTPMGRTQHEMTYILNTVLDHLPIVSGSERDMDIAINIGRTDSSSSCDEFFMRTNNLVDSRGDKSRDRGWFTTSSSYYLTLYGSLRDRRFDQTFREFQKWLCRLAKRVDVNHVSVTILSDDHKPYHIEEYGWFSPYGEMFEMPSWVEESEGEPTWCEYLMWESDQYTGLPLKHVYKYVESDDVDKEMERRELWREERRNRK